MAGRILKRRELRKQADQAAQAEPTPPEPAAGTAAPKKRAGAKATPTPKAKKPRKPKAPARVRARWGVFDGGMKQLAIFDYNQRPAAEQKAADLVAKKNSIHFLQLVKEPMPDPALVEAPAGE
jgi:hypothetical protein